MSKLDELRRELEKTEDFMEKMELQDQIRQEEIAIGQRLPDKPVDSSFECFGCGS